VKAVFFDLDYTLYDQRQYLKGALADVAEAVGRVCGRDWNSLRVSLFRTWNRLGTDCAYLFDAWLGEAGIFTPALLTLCVEAFHGHRARGLHLFKGADRVLRKLKQDYFLGLITDGHPLMQRRKVGALSLEDRFDFILYTRERSWGKPDPRIYRCALEAAAVKPGEAVYVGDHPVKDMAGARQAGLYAVRLLRGEFRGWPDDETHPPHRRIRGLPSLPGAVENLAGGER